MDYMTLKEASEKWGISTRMINYYCTEDRIPGAVKMATVWLIPKKAEKPIDRRYKNEVKTMLHIAICDDDLILSKTLYQFIFETYRDIDLFIDQYHSGEEFLNKVVSSNKTYDLLLLDIEMDKISGIAVAKELKKLSPKTYIVFITSHDEFATVGYEVSAFRYLVKPIKKAKLIEAIEAVKTELLSQKSITVQNREGEYVIPISDILCLEAQNQDVLIYTNEQQILHRGNLNEYEQQLSKDGFYRVHRSYLVNMRFVKSYSKIDVTLSGGLVLPLSRLRFKDFTTYFREYVKRTAR